MEVRNLNTFLMVASMRNFTHAARELGYSQSNVSAQIQQLEQEIGAPLFNRTGRQITLTQFGEALLPYAQELCATALKMENLLKSDDFLSGTVRLGMTDSLSELALEDALLRYHRRFPKVRLEISVDTTSMLIQRLKSGQLDAACVITDPLPRTEWRVWEELSVPVVAAANAAHPMAQTGQITLEALTRQELVLMETLAPYSLQFEQELARRHLTCEPVFRVQSTAAACRMIEQETLISVLPLYAVREAAAAGRVRILHVPEWQHTQAIQLLQHKTHARTPQIEGLLEALAVSLEEKLSP